MNKKLVFYILTLIVIVILALSLSEITLRLYERFRIMNLSSEYVIDMQDYFYYVPDPDTGLWMADPDKTKPYINSFGMYDFERTIPKKKDVFRIAVIGDSYMNGCHVGLGNRMTDIIEKEFKGRVEVLNFGISSVGTVQELYIYRSKVRQFKPDLVILGFLTGNDVRNNSRKLESSTGYGYLKNAPYCEKKPDGRFEYFPARPGVGTNKISYILRRYSYLYRFLRTKAMPAIISYLKDIRKKETDFRVGVWPRWYMDYGVYESEVMGDWQEAWDITEHTVLKFRQEVEADNSRFLLLILVDPLQVFEDVNMTVKKEAGFLPPKGFSVDYPSERLVRFASKNGMDCLNLGPVFKRYIKENDLKEPYFSFRNDGHWNRLGNKVAADALKEYLIDRYKIDV